jgi:hypothetical protein
MNDRWDTWIKDHTKSIAKRLRANPVYAALGVDLQEAMMAREVLHVQYQQFDETQKIAHYNALYDSVRQTLHAHLYDTLVEMVRQTLHGKDAESK